MSPDEKITAEEYAARQVLRRQGEVIRARREEAGITQASLAEVVGTSQQTIDRIERGESRHSRFLTKVLLALGIEPNPYDHMALGRLEAPPKRQPSVKPAGVQFEPSEMPIYRMVYRFGGPQELFVSDQAIDYIQRPPMLAKVEGAYGLLVLFETMSPALRDGDLALVHPHLPPRAGNEVVLLGEAADDPGDEVPVTLQVLRGSSARSWIGQTWSDRVDAELPRAAWPRCHVIVGKYSRI